MTFPLSRQSLIAVGSFIALLTLSTWLQPLLHPPISLPPSKLSLDWSVSTDSGAFYGIVEWQKPQRHTVLYFGYHQFVTVLPAFLVVAIIASSLSILSFASVLLIRRSWQRYKIARHANAA